jgi:predicted secreted protein
LLATICANAFAQTSPAPAQSGQQDDRKAHRAAPPDWDAGLVDLLLPARRAKPVAALMNQGTSIASGPSLINPPGAGTINNRAGALLLAPGSASIAAQSSGPFNPPSTPDNWLGGPGNWSTVSKWSNGLPSSTSDVFIDNGNPKNSPVTLDVHAVINNLNIDSDDSLTISNGNTLSVNGPTVANAGTILLNSITSGASLLFNASSATLSGGGTVTMSNGSGNSIGANTLTNQETIQGSGTITVSAALNNSGIINANQSSSLLLSLKTATNTGTIEATNGGTLLIIAGTYTNTGGIIEDNSSTLQINAATINGGTITQSGAGNLQLKAATLNAPVSNSGTGTIEVMSSGFGATTISGTLTNPSGGQVKIDDGAGLTITAPTINNSGTISMNSIRGATTLTIGAPNVTLTGSGSLTMSNSSSNVITGSSPSNILTNQETISGSGNIGNGFMVLDNNSGTINANQTTPLILDISNGATATNTGTLEATNGGTLDILGGTYANTGGTIQNNASTLVIEATATINGGLVTQSGAGTIQLGGATINAALDNSSSGTIEVLGFRGVTTFGGTLTNPSGGQLKIDNGANLTITAPTINNAGAISMNSSGSATTLTIGAPSVTLTGGGTLTMSNSADNIITGSAPTNKLINQETISGSGNIGNNFMALNNSGTINANQTAPLTLQISNGATNTGTIEATSGGTLIINGGTYTNTGGTIQNNGGTLMIQGGATINGGTVSLAGSSTDMLANSTINAPVTNSSTGTIEALGFSGVTTISGKFTNPLGGLVKIDNGGMLDFSGPVSNSGMIWMNSTGSTTELEIGAPKVTFSGKGTIMMSNNSANLITGAMPTDMLIFQGTMEGGGSLGNGGMGLTNSGTILANDGTLTIFPSSKNFINTGKLTVTSGNELSFIGSTSNAFTTSGTVNVNSGGNFTFQAGFAAYDQTKGTTTVDGKLTAPNGFNISGGTVYGNLGIFVGNFNLSGTGAINPGDGIKKVGELTINGNFTIQAPTAISIFDLGGTASGKFDFLNISNSASLGGKLTVDLVNNFKPVAGNSFGIMTYASESGMFSSETLPVITGDHWLVTIGATDVMLQLLSGSGPTTEVGGASAQAVSSGFFSQPAGGADYAGGAGFIGNVPPSTLPDSQFDDSSYSTSGFSNSGAQKSPTPEPSTLLLLASALMGTGIWAWRKR